MSESERDDIGLDGSPAFVAHVERLRETWPANPALAAKHGVPAGNGQFSTTTMTTESAESESIANQQMARRGFMAAMGVAAASAATAGVVAGETADAIPAWDSEYSQNPFIRATATVDEHTEEMAELEFINNEGNVDSLGNYGGVLAAREDDDEPHNPVRFVASKIETSEFTAFPRDGEREDSDGDDVDVSALEADRWTASGLDLTDDGDALEVSGGDTDSATFDLSEFDAVITSGIQRKYVQLVADVTDIDGGTTVTLTVSDGTNSVEVVIDPDADTDDVDVVADGVYDGVVYQAEIGELEGGTDLDEISEVELSIDGGDASLRIAGLNLERESRWSFGTRERLDEDDEVETETLYEPLERTGIVALDGIYDQFGDAEITDLEYDIELRASESPNANWSVEVEEPERGDYDQIYRKVGGLEIPRGYYDLSVEADDLTDTVAHPGSRYLTYEIDTGADEVPDFDDVDDMSWTDRTDEMADNDEGDEVELSSSLSGSDVVAFHVEVQEDEDIVSEMWTEPGAAGAAPLGGGGIMTNVWGWVLAAVTGVAGFAALMARRARSAAPGGN